MSFIPKPHEIYKHFKGNLYQIVAIAEHSETGEQLVIYQALYGDFKTYARPLAMFIGRVDKEKYPDVTQKFRFELQGADSDRQREAMQEEVIQDENMQVECGQETTVINAETVVNIDKVVVMQQETQTDGQKAQTKQQTIAEEAEELQIDPLVLEFLDADSYEQRLNILAALHHRITDEMITTMAIACDIEVTEGDTEERYDSLKNCLLTLEKYECNRLR